MTAEAIRAALACGRPGCACHRPGGRVTHCPVHEPDRRPSCGVDERDGRVLVHCRAGCAQDRVIDALRDRGLWLSASPPRPMRARSPLAEALIRIRREAERQRRRLEPLRDIYFVSDFIRSRIQLAAEVRRVATMRGEDERSWQLFDLAARAEREAWTVELELDECLPLPRQEVLDAPIIVRRSA